MFEKLTPGIYRYGIRNPVTEISYPQGGLSNIVTEIRNQQPRRIWNPRPSWISLHGPRSRIQHSHYLTKSVALLVFNVEHVTAKFAV